MILPFRTGISDSRVGLAGMLAFARNKGLGIDSRVLPGSGGIGI
jgi:hypothetical protein